RSPTATSCPAGPPTAAWSDPTSRAPALLSRLRGFQRCYGTGGSAAELAPPERQQQHAQVGAGRAQVAEPLEDGHLAGVHDARPADVLAGGADGVRDGRTSLDQPDQLGVDGVDLQP